MPVSHDAITFYHASVNRGRRRSLSDYPGNAALVAGCDYCNQIRCRAIVSLPPRHTLLANPLDSFCYGQLPNVIRVRVQDTIRWQKQERLQNIIYIALVHSLEEYLLLIAVVEGERISGLIVRLMLVEFAVQRGTCFSTITTSFSRGVRSVERSSFLNKTLSTSGRLWRGF